MGEISLLWDEKIRLLRRAKCEKAKNKRNGFGRDFGRFVSTEPMRFPRMEASEPNISFWNYYFFRNVWCFILVVKGTCDPEIESQPQFFKKMDQPRPLFWLFSVFKNNTNQCEYIHPVYGAGLEPTTVRTWVVSHNHKTRAPAQTHPQILPLFFNCG